MDEMNFEPFFDYDGITDEMIDDLHQVFVAYKKASDRFTAMKSRREAIRVLETQTAVRETYDAVMAALWTVPAMVHIAGPKRQETHPEHHSEATLQRCQRCGSILQLWHDHMLCMTEHGPEQVTEENVEWWAEGDMVGKSNYETGMNLYEIDDRELHSWEHPCVDIKGIVGTLFGEEGK